MISFNCRLNALKTITRILASIVCTFIVLSLDPASAQSYSSGLNKRNRGLNYIAHSNGPTRINAVRLMPVSTATISRGYSGQGARNGLPPTALDSFVLNAGVNAELIYGDEGGADTNNLPPYMGFDDRHRIEKGIQGARAEGLTTDHQSDLPSAWGSDEFVNSGWNNRMPGTDSDYADHVNSQSGSRPNQTRFPWSFNQQESSQSNRTTVRPKR